MRIGPSEGRPAGRPYHRARTRSWLHSQGSATAFFPRSLSIIEATRGSGFEGGRSGGQVGGEAAAEGEQDQGRGDEAEEEDDEGVGIGAGEMQG